MIISIFEDNNKYVFVVIVLGIHLFESEPQTIPIDLIVIMNTGPDQLSLRSSSFHTNSQQTKQCSFCLHPYYIHQIGIGRELQYENCIYEIKAGSIMNISVTVS